MKKRWISLLLILVLLLTACGSGKTAEPAQEAEGSAAAEPESSTATEPENTASDDIWKDGLMTLGAVDGDTYRNEVLGFGCTLPGWEFADSEDIAQENEWGKETMAEDLQEKIANSDSYMDMMAAAEDGLANVNINVMNMNRIYSAIISEEKYIELALPDMPGSLEGIGCTNVKAEATTVVLDGEEHAGMAVSSEMEGIPLYQKLAIVKVSGYLFAITATSFVEDTTDEILAQFFKL